MTEQVRRGLERVQREWSRNYDPYKDIELKDLRIAELEAEVAQLRALLKGATDGCNGTDVNGTGGAPGSLFQHAGSP